jgi:hypothetical protein
MFYKAIGFVIWKLGTAYVRDRFGRQLKIAGALAVASIVAAGYLAARSATEE